MAEIVLGLGTSHSPMLSLPAELWGEFAARDKGNPMLLSLEDGRVMSYEELLEAADPAIAQRLTTEVFQQQYEACQKAIGILEEALAEERAAVMRCGKTKDQIEGMRAFLEKRRPVFTGE